MARLEPVRERDRPRGCHHARPADRRRRAAGRRAGLLHAIPVRRRTSARSSSPVGGPGRVGTSSSRRGSRSTAGRLRRSRPPGSRRSTSRLRRCPTASSTSLTTTSTRSATPSNRTRSPPCCVEPLQGEGGVIVPSSDYLAGVRQLCTERGVLLMLDEVQTGLGRTGRVVRLPPGHLRPDVVTMAKALGNGMPVGACWATRGGGRGVRPRRPRLDVRRPAAGHGCRAGDALSDGGRGRLRPGPAGRRASWPAARRVAPGRRRPRCRAAAGGRDRDGRRGRRRREGLAGGLLVNPVRPDAIRLAPPLLVSEAEIDEALGILADVLERTVPVVHPALPRRR